MPFGRSHELHRRTGLVGHRGHGSSAVAKRGKWALHLAVVGLSAERAAKEAQNRDDMIRVAHKAGASLRQLSDVSGLDRNAVTAISRASERTGG